MTEAEWLSCKDPNAILNWLYKVGSVDRRRLGLFFKALCDRVPQSPTVEVVRREPRRLDDPDSDFALTQADVHLLGAIGVAVRQITQSGRDSGQLAALARDIFGNPFRPAGFSSRWRSADAMGVALAIYEDDAFERMPILADALMDAGCEDEQIIGHCRSEGPHARGCWVVDLVLAKE